MTGREGARDTARAASRYLSRLDLNVITVEPVFVTHWCRVAFSRFERINTKLQRHSFFELHFCLSGECEFLVDGASVRLTGGEFLLVPPGKEHIIIDVTDDFEKLVWGFSLVDDSDAEALATGCSKAVFPLKADKQWFVTVERLLLEGGLGAECSVVIVNNELYYLYSALKRMFVRSHQSDQTPKKVGIRAGAVCRFIEDNLEQSPTLSDIAAQFYISERQLERICLAEYGVSAGELRHRIQAQVIRRLLAETTLSLSEIAKKTGFSDRYSMSKFFKKAEGLPPAAYRSAILE